MGSFTTILFGAAFLGAEKPRPFASCAWGEELRDVRMAERNQVVGHGDFASSLLKGWYTET